MADDTHDFKRSRATFRMPLRASMSNALVVLTLTSILMIWASTTTFNSPHLRAAPAIQSVPINAQEILSHCSSLRTAPGPSQAFHSREVSDRYEAGTNATFIKNAVIFTGGKNGNEVIHGSILMDKGIVKSVGEVPDHLLEEVMRATVVDAKGAWVTPGLVDLHTHLGVLSAPVLSGAYDLSSVHGPILPWLRSIDGFNTHDESFQLSIAGGVTSAQVLPGSENAIGGQAFMIKLRKTKEGSPTSMIVDPPHTLTGNNSDYNHWRHLKQACGENLRRYGTRPDSMWAVRFAYNEARKIKLAQDAYCAKAEAGVWDGLGQFPESLQWEALVDVLRGRVKISNHCYEAVDLDNIVRLSNEFKFPIASFHHASEAWLVPELLKKTWGGTPGIAMFATNHRYKREAYRGSEFAPRVLADEGIPVVMKSDHPVINSRYLLYEAQQAHYFSLPANLSLASVTSTPATIAGLSHRIGFLREGADADVVIWDSHPLQLGATPVKVWIDGILQIPVPSKTDEPNNIEVGKGKEDNEWKAVPSVPNWDKERKKAIEWDGLPPLQSNPIKSRVRFSNVKAVLRRDLKGGGVNAQFNAASDSELGEIIVENGQIVCVGLSCSTFTGSAKVIDLQGGSISPGFMTYGSPLGMEEMAGEPSTGDGIPYDAFARNVPSILDDSGAIVRAMDALMFGTRDALTAYRSGITLATSSLSKAYYLDGTAGRIISGLSVTFSTGLSHALERGAIVQDIAALHVHIGRPHPLIVDGVSVSTQIAALRRLLFGWETQDKETGYWFRQAAEGVVPLVIEVDNADIMASLLIVKVEVEDRIGSRMRMVFSGAAEAHLLAKEIGEAEVGVILRQARPFPTSWDQRRILPGPPLTNDTALVKLLHHGVTVALGVRESWEARNARFDIQWAILESNGRISEREMHALAYTNLPKLLGVREDDDKHIEWDLVAYEGGGAFDLARHGFQQENQADKSGPHLKKAMRDMDRSSCGVREDAKMERRTAGVTGMRLSESEGGWRAVCNQLYTHSIAMYTEHLNTTDDGSSFHEDMIKVIDRLPTQEEYRRVKQLVLQKQNEPRITDDQLALSFDECPHLETVVLSGVPDVTDRTLVVLAKRALNLQGVDLSGCDQVTDIGVLELTAKSLPLQWIQLNGVIGLTDPSVSAIAKTCSRLAELELCDLPLLTSLSVRDVWSFSRKLRTLRFARCPLLTDKSFPSTLGPELLEEEGAPGEKPLPPRPVTWLDQLPPLILRHTAVNLRMLDLTSCRITDDAIEGIIAHAPKIQSLILSGCTMLTNRALKSISKLGEHLDVLMLAHVSSITDGAIVKLARACWNLRCVDVAFCRNLTDMSVFEFASLKGLRRLSLVRVQKLTDIAIFALAEHAACLERLHLSYCDRLSLDAVHKLLKKRRGLLHLTATGVPSFRRKGVDRFSEHPPESYDDTQRAAFRVFSGDKVTALRRFLDKEDQRRRDAEAQNIPFVARSDDKVDLY
ncbi:hypothetical protein H0H87_007923 [Tephrocybe sp. NHM501043]|nr:hypothetical protein H0H87_007923 [Tephrocybe sp. NHM501043]